jgi:hypothetical protein
LVDNYAQISDIFGIRVPAKKYAPKALSLGVCGFFIEYGEGLADWGRLKLKTA